MAAVRNARSEAKSSNSTGVLQSKNQSGIERPIFYRALPRTRGVMNRWLERSYRIFAGSLCLVVLSAIAVGSEEEKLNRLERFRLRGFVAYENFSFLENRDAELIAFRNEVKFLPDLDMRFSDQL